MNFLQFHRLYFNEYGVMRKTKKAVIMTILAIYRVTDPSPVDLQLVDGNEALFNVSWPKQSTVQSFATIFVKSFPSSVDTFVVFDKCIELSLKSHERQRLSQGVTTWI